MLARTLSYDPPLHRAVFVGRDESHLNVLRETVGPRKNVYYAFLPHIVPDKYWKGYASCIFPPYKYPVFGKILRGDRLVKVVRWDELGAGEQEVLEYLRRITGPG